MGESQRGQFTRQSVPGRSARLTPAMKENTRSSVSPQWSPVLRRLISEVRRDKRNATLHCGVRPGHYSLTTASTSRAMVGPWRPTEHRRAGIPIDVAREAAETAGERLGNARVEAGERLGAARAAAGRNIAAARGHAAMRRTGGRHRLEPEAPAPRGLPPVGLLRLAGRGAVAGPAANGSRAVAACHLRLQPLGAARHQRPLSPHQLAAGRPAAGCADSTTP